MDEVEWEGSYEGMAEKRRCCGQASVVRKCTRVEVPWSRTVGGPGWWEVRPMMRRSHVRLESSKAGLSWTIGVGVAHGPHLVDHSAKTPCSGTSITDIMTVWAV